MNHTKYSNSRNYLKEPGHYLRRKDETTGSLWNTVYVCGELENVVGVSARTYFVLDIVVIHRFVSVLLVLVKNDRNIDTKNVQNKYYVS